MLVYGGSASSEQFFFALLPRALRAGLWQSVVFGLLAALLVDGLPRPRFWLLLLLGRHHGLTFNHRSTTLVEHHFFGGVQPPSGSMVEHWLNTG